MARRSTPPAQDIPNLTVSSHPSHQANVDATATRIEAFWAVHPGWGYQSLFKATPIIVSKCRTEEEASGIFSHIKHDTSRTSHQGAARCLFHAYKHEEIVAYEIKPRHIELRRNPLLMATVRAGAITVKNQNPVILVPQPRLHFEMSLHRWSFYQWLTLRAHVTGDEAGLPLEFTDLSATENGERTYTKFESGDIPTMSTDEALNLITIFLAGFDVANRRAPRDTKTRRSVSAPILPLFPDN